MLQSSPILLLKNCINLKEVSGAMKRNSYNEKSSGYAVYEKYKIEIKIS